MDTAPITTSLSMSAGERGAVTELRPHFARFAVEHFRATDDLSVQVRNALCCTCPLCILHSATRV